MFTCPRMTLSNNYCLTYFNPTKVKKQAEEENIGICKKPVRVISNRLSFLGMLYNAFCIFMQFL